MNEPAYPRSYGSYTLLERLGVGGMSEVDLARRTVGDGGFVRFLAIKRIRAGNAVDEQYVRMFQDEARINAELSHENIAQVYDFGREGDEFYMAMEYVPGLDLRAVQLALAKRGKLIPVRIVLTVLCGVLRALQYAHTRVDQLGRPMNIVHRDVNPRNIMISVNGEVKLIDFGVAKAADRLEKTEHDTVKGKFAYMAPEQIEGSRAVDGRADLFAVALCLHELLTGRSPFAGLTEVQILHRILAGSIPPLPDSVDYPDLLLLRRIHAKGLAVRPDDRHLTADAFRAALEAALAPLGGLAPPMWIAELLREAAGDGVSDITRRLRAYREGRATGPVPTPPVRPPPQEASGTLNVASIEAPPAGPAWLAFAAAGVGVLAALLLGASAVGMGVAFSLRDASPSAPSPALAPPGAVPAAPPDAPVVPDPAASASPPPAGVSTPNARPAGASPPAPPSAGMSAEASATPRTAPPAAAPAVVSAAPAPPSAPVAVTDPAPAAPTVAAPAPVVASSPVVAEGYLNVTSRPLKLDVYVDGRKVGVTPLRLHRLPVGTHDVSVRDPVSGRADTRAVTIVDGVAVTPPPVILE